MNFVCKREFFNFWHNRYDIYDENDQIVYLVKPRRKFVLVYDILDTQGNIIFTIKKRYFRILARCDLYDNDGKFAFIMKQKFSAFARALKLKPCDKEDKNDYKITGDMLALDFALFINDQAEAGFTKKIVTLVDTLQIKVVEEKYVPLACAVSIMIQMLYKKQTRGSAGKSFLFGN